jgi:hypothetical protein
MKPDVNRATTQPDFRVDFSTKNEDIELMTTRALELLAEVRKVRALNQALGDGLRALRNKLVESGVALDHPWVLQLDEAIEMAVKLGSANGGTGP